MAVSRRHAALVAHLVSGCAFVATGVAHTLSVLRKAFLERLSALTTTSLTTLLVIGALLMATGLLTLGVSFSFAPAAGRCCPGSPLGSGWRSFSA